MITYKNILIAFALLAALGIAIWTTFLSFYSQPLMQVKNDLSPDAYMEDVSAIIMDKEGKLQLKIITPKMVHYPQDDVSHLWSPQLTLYRQSPIPWHITSKFAKATQGIENVDFWENVLIRFTGDGNTPATVIKTDKLTVFPDDNIAQTEALITLNQPNLIAQSKGMYADMNSGDIKLKSQARGEYAPIS